VGQKLGEGMYKRFPRQDVKIVLLITRPLYFVHSRLACPNHDITSCFVLRYAQLSSFYDPISKLSCDLR
jgi:hypothetical protein